MADRVTKQPAARRRDSQKIIIRPCDTQEPAQAEEEAREVGRLLGLIHGAEDLLLPGGGDAA